MASSEGLVRELEVKFGLRNIKDLWIRRVNSLSSDVLVGPICRTDLHEVTSGTAPWNIFQAHAVQLQTKMLVQIEDIINISNADPRNPDFPRTLQLSLSDGAMDFVGVEVEPLGSSISMKTIPGTKIILLPSVWIRRGRVMLTAKDFKFLGPPLTNIWGDSYEQRIATSLTQAGLQNSRMSTFDSLTAGNGTASITQNGVGGAMIPMIDMGGIADAVPDADNENDDDDDFWIHAADMVDRTVNFTNNVQEPQPEPPILIPSNDDEHLVPSVVNDEEEDQHNQIIDVITLDDTPQRPPRRRRTIVEESDDENDSEVEVPNMPMCDSDTNDNSSDVSLYPMVRLESLKSSNVRSTGQHSLCRVYSLRANKNIKPPNHEHLHSGVVAYLDDGTDLITMNIKPEFLAEIVTTRDQRQGTLNENVHKRTSFRQMIRGICGMVEIEHNDGAIAVTGFMQDPSKMVRVSFQ